jgi:bifunctional non-homologous end joining protein LigD
MAKGYEYSKGKYLVVEPEEIAKLRIETRNVIGVQQKTHQMIRSRLDRLKQKNSPFMEIPRAERRSALWVEPELVAEVTFSNWTRDSLVRQAAFKGLREDKPAREVVREAAVELKATKRTSPKWKSAQSNRKDAKGMEELAITHPDKVLDPQSGITKRQLAEYYLAVAAQMLPHIADRPISVVRCPDGLSKACFFQKHVGLGLPEGVKTISIPNRKSKEKEDFLTVDSSRGLLGLAQMGVLEIHPWGARNQSLDTPDRMVFDLDPDAAIGWKTLAETALALKAKLKKAGLESFVKSTGGKGLHVVVPIRPDREWPEVKEFAHRMVQEMEREKPELYVTKMTKATRKNRIYLDYLRNDRESTSVAPFSPRAPWSAGGHAACVERTRLRKGPDLSHLRFRAMARTAPARSVAQNAREQTKTNRLSARGDRPAKAAFGLRAASAISLWRRPMPRASGARRIGCARPSLFHAEECGRVPVVPLRERRPC